MKIIIGKFLVILMKYKKIIAIIAVSFVGTDILVFRFVSAKKVRPIGE